MFGFDENPFGMALVILVFSIVGFTFGFAMLNIL